VGIAVIKLTFCLHRLPHLAREAFQDYWRNKHAPLVAKNREALRIRRYVQCHALTTELNDAIRAARQAPEQYDGIAELWWDNLDGLVAAMSSPDGQEAGLELLEDERKFIDLPRSPLWLNREFEVFD
jgi:uncharacterized protein (TIGR02118 family)